MTHSTPGVYDDLVDLLLTDKLDQLPQYHLRAALPVAAGDFARKHDYLFFGAADEDSWVYVNGELIFNHTFETTGLIPFEIWMTSYTVDLSEVELRGGRPPRRPRKEHGRHGRPCGSPCI